MACDSSPVRYAPDNFITNSIVTDSMKPSASTGQFRPFSKVLVKSVVVAAAPPSAAAAVAAAG